MLLRGLAIAAAVAAAAAFEPFGGFVPIEPVTLIDPVVPIDDALANPVRHCIAARWDHPTRGALLCLADNAAGPTEITCADPAGARVLRVLFDGTVAAMMGSAQDQLLYVAAAGGTRVDRMLALEEPDGVRWESPTPLPLRTGGVVLRPGPGGSGVVAAVGRWGQGPLRFVQWDVAGQQTTVGQATASFDTRTFIDADVATMPDGRIVGAAAESGMQLITVEGGAQSARQFGLSQPTRVSVRAGEPAAVVAASPLAGVIRQYWWEPANRTRTSLPILATATAVSGPGGRILLAEAGSQYLWLSDDAGVSWQSPGPLAMPGTLVRLADDRVMAFTDRSAQVCVNLNQDWSQWPNWRREPSFHQGPTDQTWQQFGGTVRLGEVALPLGAGGEPRVLVLSGVNSGTVTVQLILGTVAPDGTVAWQLQSQFTTADWPDPLMVSMLALDDGTVVAVSLGHDTTVRASSDEGRTWEVVGQRPPGRSYQVVSVGNAVVVFTQELTREHSTMRRQVSTDGGRTWTDSDIGLIHGVLPAAIVALDTGLLVAIAGLSFPEALDERSAVNLLWWSRDLGATWEKAPDLHWSPRAAHRAVFVNRGVGVLLMGGRAWDGALLSDVWRSTDEGASWHLVNAAAPWAGRERFGLTVLPAGVLLLAGGVTDAQPDGARDVWTSPDMGATWQQLHEAAAFPASTFAEAVTTRTGAAVLFLRDEVWRSADGGSSWHLAAGDVPWAGAERLAVTVRADGALLAGEGERAAWGPLYISYDEGETWWTQSQQFRGSQIVTMPSGALVAYMRTPPQAAMSLDGGRTWAPLGNLRGDGFTTFDVAMVALPSGRLLATGGRPGTLPVDWSLVGGFSRTALRLTVLSTALAQSWLGNSVLTSAHAMYASEQRSALMLVGVPGQLTTPGECVAEYWDVYADTHWLGACRGMPVDVAASAAAGRLVALSQPQDRPDRFLLAVWFLPASIGVDTPRAPHVTVSLRSDDGSTLHSHGARVLFADSEHAVVVALRGPPAERQLVAFVVHLSGAVKGSVAATALRPPVILKEVFLLPAGAAGPAVVVVAEGEPQGDSTARCESVVLPIGDLLDLPLPSPPTVPVVPCLDPAEVQQERECACACAEEAGAEPHCCLPGCMQQEPVPARVLEALGALLQPGEPVPADTLARSQDGLLRFARRASVQVCIAADRLPLPVALHYFVPGEHGGVHMISPLFPEVGVAQGCARPGDCVTVEDVSAGTAMGLLFAPLAANDTEEAQRFSVAALNPAGQPHFVLALDDALAADDDEAVVLVGVETRGAAVPDFADVELYVRVRALAGPAGEPVLEDVHLMRTTMGLAAAHGAEFCPAEPEPEPEPSDTVVAGGRAYALLDHTQPAELQLGCQRGRLRVPLGWTVAPPTPETFRALTAAPWGAECVVLSNGWAYRPSTGERCLTERPLLQDMVVECVGVRRCARVLLINGTDAGSAPGLVEPYFDDLMPLQAEFWMPFGLEGTFAFESDSACGAGGSVRLTAEGAVYWRILNPDLLRDGLTISLWSRAEGVELVPGSQDPFYGAFVDAEYASPPHDFGLTAEFSAGTHGWEYREVSIRPRPGGRPLAARLYLMLRGFTGRVWFSCVRFRRWDGNMLHNPGFAQRADYERQDELLRWFSLSYDRLTYSLSEHGLPRGAETNASPDPILRPGEHGLLLSALSCEGVPHEAPGDMCGAQQFPQFSGAWLEQQGWDSVLISGCARGQGVGESAHPADFSIYMDVWYADGTRHYGLHAPFPSGTFGWTCVARVYPLRGRVQQFVVGPLLRNRAAQQVLFDNVHVVPFRRMPVVRAAAFGDPFVLPAWAGDEAHRVSAQGDYVLFEDGTLTLHARLQPAAASGGQGARVTEVAARHGPRGVTVQVGASGVAWVDGRALALPPVGTSLALPLHGGAAMLRQETDGTVRVRFADGYEVETRRLVSGVSVQLQVPSAQARAGSGMLVTPAGATGGDLRGAGEATQEAWARGFLLEAGSSIVVSSGGASTDDSMLWAGAQLAVECDALSSNAVRAACEEDGGSDPRMADEALRLQDALQLAGESRLPAQTATSAAMAARLSPLALLAVAVALLAVRVAGLQ